MCRHVCFSKHNHKVTYIKSRTKILYLITNIQKKFKKNCWFAFLNNSQNNIKTLISFLELGTVIHLICFKYICIFIITHSYFYLCIQNCLQTLLIFAKLFDMFCCC